jgi:hypothetical protein
MGSRALLTDLHALKRRLTWRIGLMLAVQTIAIWVLHHLMR